MLLLNFDGAKVYPFSMLKNEMERCDESSAENKHIGTKVPKAQLKVSILRFHPSLLVPVGTEKH